jgi:hypothetical protein
MVISLNLIIVMKNELQFKKYYLYVKKLRNPLYFLITIRLYAEGFYLEPRFGGAYFFTT